MSYLLKLPKATNFCFNVQIPLLTADKTIPPQGPLVAMLELSIVSLLISSLLNCHGNGNDTMSECLFKFCLYNISYCRRYNILINIVCSTSNNMSVFCILMYYITCLMMYHFKMAQSYVCFKLPRHLHLLYFYCHLASSNTWMIIISTLKYC